MDAVNLFNATFNHVPQTTRRNIRQEYTIKKRKQESDDNNSDKSSVTSADSKSSEDSVSKRLRQTTNFQVDEDVKESDEILAQIFSNEELNSRNGGRGAAAAPRVSINNNKAWLREDEQDKVTDLVIHDKYWCFPCKYSLEVNEADRVPDFPRLLKLINDNHGMMDDQILCTMIQEFYNKYLRECTKEQKPWARVCIYNHIYDHKPTPQRDACKNLQIIKEIKDVLVENNVFHVSDSGRTGADNKSVELLLKLMDKQEKLHKFLSESNASRQMM